MRYWVLLSCNILSLVSVRFSVAQTPEPVIARAVYTYRHQLDTTKDDRYKEDMLLVLGKTASVFTSLDKQYQNESLIKQEEEQTKAWTGDDMPVFKFNFSRYTTPTEYFNFRAEHKLFVKDFLGQAYYFQDEYPDIKWQLSNDTLTVAGYKCKTAAATYKGRKWIVAYAPELPFSTGPWKLGGLPGLITEAHDSKNQIQYRLVSLEKQGTPSPEQAQDEYKEINYSLVNEIRLPDERYTAGQKVKIAKISKQDALKLYTARDKDPVTFLRGQMSMQHGVGDVQAFMTFYRRPKTNNPIEKDK